MSNVLIQELNQSILDNFRRELQPTLDKVGQRYGVKFDLGRITYGSKHAYFKVEVSTLDESGNAVTKEATAFIERAHHHGLKPEWLHRAFEYEGESYEVIGLSTRRSKRPVIAMCGDKQFTFVANVILEAFEPETAAKKLDSNCELAKRFWIQRSEQLPSLGIDDSWLGKEVVLDGHAITIEGLNMHAVFRHEPDVITIRINQKKGKAELRNVNVDTVSRLMKITNAA
jgi:hypothetical protein